MKWEILAILGIIVICLAGAVLIALNFDPFQSGLLIKSLFVASALLSFLGVAVILFWLWEVLIFKNYNLKLALVRSLFISLIALVFFVLRRIKIENWAFYAIIVLLASFIYKIIVKIYYQKKSIEDFS